MLKMDLGNFAATMDTARKMLRLFESARVYVALLEEYKQSDNSVDKYLKIANKCAMMLYWAAQNLFILSKLRILPLRTEWFGKVMFLLALVAYGTLLAIRWRMIKAIDIQIAESLKIESSEKEESKGLKLRKLIIKKKYLTLLMGQELAANIWLLETILSLKNSRLASLLNGLGNFFAGFGFLYINILPNPLISS